MGIDGGRNGLINRIARKGESLLWVAKAVRAANALLTRKRYDLIMSRVAPQYGHLPALILSRKVDLPWIASWSDPMPQIKAPQPYGEGFSARIPFILKIYYREVAKRASWHIFPSGRLREYVCRYLPDCQTKSSVIPHVALKGFFAEAFQREAGFTLCHIGGLGMRNPRTFLAGVKIFLERKVLKSPFLVKFIGHDSDTSKRIAGSLGIGDFVHVEGARSYEETLNIARKCTVLVIIEAPCEEGVFFPSKFVDFVQTGRPILAVSPKVGTLNDILSVSGGGIAVDCKVPEEIAGAIETLYEAWQSGTLETNYGSRRLFEVFDEENILRQYTELFMRLGDDERGKKGIVEKRCRR
jgi:glycosyltransferase involved in cell wall biosynthesis